MNKISIRKVNGKLHYRKNDGLISTIHSKIDQDRFIKKLHYLCKLGDRKFIKVSSQYFVIVRVEQND